ncbi:hypothetical protein E2C01_101693 [Portunus trituberculatus]|uniref:Uncharacterized protein n=1 Tax=Portunus trituberculatus TaxID=210409 RepID=A0A5B7KAE4_PORTR|nr:hypothetical protein [Portunus trituberculatus]
MDFAWKKVLPECVHDLPGFLEDNISVIRNDIVNLCHRAGFDEVQDLLESHAEPLSNDELIELDKALQETEQEGDQEEEPVHGLDIKTLRECLRSIKKALETLKERDSNPVRSSKVAHDREKFRHVVPVTPADPTTAGPSTSAGDGSTAGPSSISSFFKLVKRADPVTAGLSISASDSADDNVFEDFESPSSPSSSSAHSAEDK